MIPCKSISLPCQSKSTPKLSRSWPTIRGSELRGDQTDSPPTFLLLSIILAHALEVQMGKEAGEISGRLARLFANSEEVLLFYRAIVISIFPMMFALAIVKRGQQKLGRKTLR